MNIPSDWTKLSDQEIKKCILYLAKHHRKYKIERQEGNSILIGADIKIKTGFIRNKGSYIKINNKYIFYDEAQEQISSLADELYKKLQRRLIPIKVKTAEWLFDNKESVVSASILALVIGLGYGVLFVASKYEERKLDKFKQEIIEGVLEQFKQEQQKLNTSILFDLKNTK